MTKAILASLITATAAIAAEPDQAQLQAFPKNLARQHLGANLFQYSSTTQAYSPTQAAAAWLDDDITTGWAMMGGKQYYLMCFPDTELLTSFALSAKPANGTISLYAGDEAAPPGAKSWAVLAKDMPFESLNERKIEKSFSRSAKYLLIEANLTDPGPIYSLYVYGERPAVAYGIQNRQQPINTPSIFGPYANDSTAFSITGLYAHSYVVPQAGQTNLTELQQAIDDNPETAVTLGGSQPAALQIQESEARSISRVAMEVTPNAKGRFEFFLRTGEAAPAAAPVATIVLDGTATRASVEFPAAEASMIEARWTPANGTDSVGIRELNAFNGMTLANSMVINNSPMPDPIADGPDDNRRKVARSDRDGKDVVAHDGKDYKDYKADPIAALDQGPYLPGALGFPPLLTARRLLGPPPPPVSP